MLKQTFYNKINFKEEGKTLKSEHRSTVDLRSPSNSTQKIKRSGLSFWIVRHKNQKRRVREEEKEQFLVIGL